MAGRSLTGPVGLTLASLLVALFAAEALLRVLEPAAAKVSAGNRLINERILRSDPDTLVHLRSNIDVPMDLFWPGWPVRIRTNATGQRMERPLPTGSGEGVYRIATLGDSSTMGWGVEANEAYPERLGAALGRGVEVLNFGTIGFSSHNGRAQLERDVLALAPDLVTIAFGFNDWSEQFGSDAARHRALRQRSQARARHPWAARALDHPHLALARRLAALWIPAEPRYELEKRVPLPAYEENLERMLRGCADAGAEVVLLNLNLPNGYGAAVLHSLARRHDVPLVDVRALFEAALPDVPAARQVKLGLAPADPASLAPVDGAQVNYRVYAPDPGPDPVLVRAVHEGRFGLATIPAPLFDDGTHGDQRAGDRVFSRSVPESDRAVDYAFVREEALTGAEGQLRYLTRFYHRLEPRSAPTGGTRQAPIQRAGEEPLRTLVIPFDVVHPNPAGHRLIAEALSEAVRALPSWRRLAREEAPPREAPPEDWFERRRRYFER